MVPENRSIEALTPILDSKLKSMGFELFDLRFFQAGSRSILRITVDSISGVTIGDCENISNELSVLLDVENFSTNRPYSLEISSPGIDRPLKTERDFSRIKGRPVVIHMSEGVGGKKTMQGEVIKCENNILQLQVDDEIIEIPLSDIYSGKEEIRFK